MPRQPQKVAKTSDRKFLYMLLLFYGYCYYYEKAVKCLLQQGYKRYMKKNKQLENTETQPSQKTANRLRKVVIMVTHDKSPK